VTRGESANGIATAQITESSSAPDKPLHEIHAPPADRPEQLDASDASAIPPPSPVPRLAPLQEAKRAIVASFDALAQFEEAVAQLESDLKAAEKERSALQEEVDRLQQRQQEYRGGPRTVEEAASVAATVFDDVLDITSHAYKSASNHDFRDPDLVLRVLSCVAHGGGDYSRTSAHLASLGNRASLSPKESAHTMRAFGDERRFVLDDGKVVECQQHITLGHGQRHEGTTLHIYFRSVGPKAQVLYIGPHLRTVSGNT